MVNFRKLIVGLIAITSLSLSLKGPAKETPPSITVFNASSTTEIIEEAGALFTEKTGIEVKTNPASSGILAKQFKMGAEADLYISASKSWMNYTEGLQIISQKNSFMQNSLVLIAPVKTKLVPFQMNRKDSTKKIFSTKLSMGDPAFVPAGTYAREALTNYGVIDTPGIRIIPASNVRAALAVVEMGEADLGIVYKTDAEKSKKVSILSYFPEDSHTPIDYFCALLKKSSPEGKLFYNFLFSEEAKKIFRKHGFITEKLHSK